MEGLESGERDQERRQWGGDRAPCGAPAVIRTMVGSDSWGGAQSLQWGAVFGKGAPTGHLRALGPNLGQAGEGALRGKQREMGGRVGGGARQ